MNRRSPFFYLLIISYGLLIFALTVVRFDVVPGEEFESWVFRFARACVLLFATIGPAWMAEDRLRRLVPVARNARDRRRLRKRIRRTEREIHKSNRGRGRIGQAQEKWDWEAKRLKAIYLATHHRTAGADRKGKS